MRIKIPLLIGDYDKLANKTKRLRGLMKPLAFEKIENALVESRLNIDAKTYLGMVLYSVGLWFTLFTGLFIAMLFSQVKALTIDVLLRGLSYGLLLGVLFFSILFYYPVIVSKKVAERIDRDLIYALQDIIIQTESGVTAFNALVNVANSDYDYVSYEFKNLVKNVEGGIPLTDDLKRLAVTTKSNYLKKSCWELHNSLKSGASIPSGLNIILDDLMDYQSQMIKNFTKELNVLSLVYLTLAVVAPSIGITMIIILSSFGGLQINEASMSGIIAILIVIQPILVGIIKSRRPNLRL